jgi:hypothetical protein
MLKKLKSLFSLDDGSKYVGEYKDGKRHGQGRIMSTHGENYVGEFKDNNRHGQGTITLPNGKKYVGEWQDGEMHGQGTETYSLMLRSPLRKLLILLMVIILIDFKTTMISMS